MRLFYVLLMGLCACSKKHEVSSAVKEIHDSIYLLSGGQKLQLDLNDDGTNDVSFSGRVDLFASGPSNEIFQVVTLSPQTKVHTVAEIFQVCKDTVTKSGFQTFNFFNCAGGGHLYSTELVRYVPRLQHSELANINFDPSPTDTVWVFNHQRNQPLVPFPNANYIDTYYGFFSS